MYALCILNLFNPYEDDKKAFQNLVYALDFEPKGYFHINFVKWQHLILNAYHFLMSRLQVK